MSIKLLTLLLIYLLQTSFPQTSGARSFDEDGSAPLVPSVLVKTIEVEKEDFQLSELDSFVVLGHDWCLADNPSYTLDVPCVRQSELQAVKALHLRGPPSV